jgi:hypothetical protein
LEEADGCVGLDRQVGDVIFFAARTNLDKDLLVEVAEHMVRSDCPPIAHKWVLRNVTFGDSMLPDLRRLAKAGDEAACVALARFHLDADVAPLIQHLQRPEPFDDTAKFLAAAISKDARLLPHLRALMPEARDLREDDLQPWLEAIAAQESRAAATLLQDVLDQANPKDERARIASVLAEVLKTHSATVFDGIRKGLEAADKKR